jgi:hypothetical protein
MIWIETRDRQPSLNGTYVVADINGLNQTTLLFWKGVWMGIPEISNRRLNSVGFWLDVTQHKTTPIFSRTLNGHGVKPTIITRRVHTQNPVNHLAEHHGRFIHSSL